MMGYAELFNAINCRCIIIIEDDFTQEDYDKNRALYDITRMSTEDRKCYLEEVKTISEKTAQAIEVYLLAFDKYFDSIGNWNNEVPNRSVEDAISLLEQKSSNDAYREIKKAYDALDVNFDNQGYERAARYGVGMNHPTYFNNLFNEYINKSNRATSIRVYTDYSDIVQKNLKEDLDAATPDSSIVCIVDNQLSGNNRAEEILQLIAEKSKTERQNIIGCIFSSKESFEKITEKLYFEYASKDKTEQLVNCIAKSAYNYFLSELKKFAVGGIDKAFDTALRNKNIAFFLSRKAQSEGVSEYEIIKEWLKLLTAHLSSNNETIKRMIVLSRVINSLNDSETTLDTSLQKLNTLEAFDYSVNDFHLPVAAGDIFKNDSGDWFVLVGQDCDMARSARRKPRNALAELLRADTKTQTEVKKWANDQKAVFVYNFRESPDDEKSEILQILYQNRCYLSNEIIALCSFNSDGKCRISLKKDLDLEISKLMPKYLIDYHKELQKYFSSVKSIRSQSDELLSNIIATSCTQHLFAINNFDMKNDEVIFNLKRVCRLNHSYVSYLYKLYLEYRGRQPFQTINLIRQANITLPVYLEKKQIKPDISVTCVIVPDKSNVRDYCWIINPMDINAVLRENNYPELKDQEHEIIACQIDTSLPLLNKKELKITKFKNKVELKVS